jgi:hypothetical protein
MRFPILALGALGLAGLTIGAAVNNDASPSATYSASVETSLSRWHPTYTASGEPWLTRTHSHSGLPGKPGHPLSGHSFSHVPSGSPVLEVLRTKPAEVIPAITTIPAEYSAIRRRGDMGPTTTFTGCSWGYFPVSFTFVDVSCSSYRNGSPEGTRTCSSVGAWPTMGCSQTMCPTGSNPRQPTATSDTETCTRTYTPCPTRSWCKKAKFAARTTQDLGGRSQRAIAQFAARATHTTNDLGGRSQRWVARFAEPTITPTPTEVAAASVTWPICSFDVTKGEYICPEAAKTLPLCSFDVTKGEYICPTAVAATPTPTEEKLYHVNARDNKIPPPDRCAECALAIDDCRTDCNEDDQDCYDACPCEMHQQIPACQRCKGYKHACDGSA